MSGATATLAISGLTSGYGEEIVVRGISLTVGSGEIVALLGKNGMGKSTLLKTVMGFLPAREGQVTLYGHDVTRDSPHRIARRAIAYTPQEQAIFQDLTVGDNLRLGQSEARWFEEELERVGEVFPFLEERLGQRAGTLSGGEQKMLLIARTLMEMDLAERLLLVLEAGNDAGATSAASSRRPFRSTIPKAIPGSISVSTSTPDRSPSCAESRPSPGCSCCPSWAACPGAASRPAPCRTRSAKCCCRRHRTGPVAGGSAP